MQNKNKTVIKSKDLLTLFLIHSKLSFNEIIQLTGTPKTSVHRMLGSLEDMGFLDKDEDNLYSLGLLFLQFGQLVADRLDVREIALPVMKKLRDETEEAVNLIIKDGDEAMYVEKLDSTHPVRLYTAVGRRSPLYAGACPRIILAFFPKEEQEQYLKIVDFKAYASGTITDVDKLRLVLEETRQAGYAISKSELEDHTTAIAAPIFNHKGQVVGGLSLAGPDIRFQAERLPEFIKKVKKHAQEVSEKMGYAGDVVYK
ncbi:IclR family transcriptional regulator [Niallia nealsonii]|uniref:IclR family transcriptional regulator n=1 Tax=Niallia nealsonii TaxID=115979 RepID=A0A2N0Z1C5_9BACI|nr:IclR family transcriptional regulator [Niallia nealsonii]PKG23299.1 IclR family transcriptional regulator [Niallia nealsonii]